MSDFHFDTLGSEELLIAPIIAVRRDRVSMPGGRVANREIVEHFGAVAIVAERDDGSIALLQQYRHSIGRRLWELPAGLLDVPEEDALTAAQRELYEEVGVNATQWDLLTDIVTSPGVMDEGIRIYHARGLTEIGRPEATDEEAEMTVTWIPLTQAQQMVLTGEICNATSVTGIMLAGSVQRSVEEPFDLRPHRLAERKTAGAQRGQ